MKISRPIQITSLVVALALLAAGFFAMRGTPPATPGFPEVQIEIPQEWATQYSSNLGPLLTSARVVPYVDEKTGKRIGLRIVTIEPKSPAEILGLQAEDIVLQVEDVVFDEASKGLKAVQALRGKSRVTALVQRAGEKKTFVYTVK
jgi:S1-C subfamily serine protease